VGSTPAGRDVMRTAPIRIICFLLMVPGVVLCQQPDTRGAANSLPDAPTVQTPAREQMVRAFWDTARPPVDTLSLADGQQGAESNSAPFEFNVLPKAKNWADSSPQASSLFSASETNSADKSLMGRAAEAASSVVYTRDLEGRKRLNTSYLLRVATMAAAHVAYRPYWRRSASQPLGDFGSTIGSEAGMNVLHTFEPGIRQLVKNHEPRFVSRIQLRSHPD